MELSPQTRGARSAPTSEAGHYSPKSSAATSRGSKSSPRFLELLYLLLEEHEQEIERRDVGSRKERRTTFATEPTVAGTGAPGAKVLILDTDEPVEGPAVHAKQPPSPVLQKEHRRDRARGPSEETRPHLVRDLDWGSTGLQSWSDGLGGGQGLIHQTTLMNLEPQQIRHAPDRLSLDGDVSACRADSAGTNTRNCSNSSRVMKHLQLRETWKSHPDSHNDDADRYSAPEVHRRSIAAVKSRTSSKMSFDWRNGKFSINSLVSLPSANWRMTWDIIGAVFIGCDTIWIPFFLCFRPARHWLSTSIDLMTMVYWTIDIPLCFFVGYHDQGNLVMSPLKICRHYLTTWFVLDMAVVTADWVNTLGTHRVSQMGAVGELARSLRVVRIARLLRLLKLKRFAAQIQDTISSETAFLMLNLVKLLFFILTLNHCIACLWFFVGTEGKRVNEPNWIIANEIESASIGYQYTTSLHWTLTQFTPASMEVFPQNTIERSMAVVVLIFALVAFSSFVGSISASVTTLRNMNADTNKQFWLLRRFLKTHSVKKSLVFRIIKYLEYALDKGQGTVQVSSLKVLHHLSEQLEEELHMELRRSTLATHPLLNHLMHEMPVVVRRLCGQALKSLTLASEDSLFYAGDEGINMYCFTAGSLSLLLEEEGQVASLDPPPQRFEWISEASLWVSWKHQGKLRAHTESEFTAVNSAKFVEVIRKNVASWYPTALYAWTWVSHWSTEAVDIPRDHLLTEAVQKELQEHGTFRSAKRVLGASLATAILDPRIDSQLEYNKVSHFAPELAAVVPTKTPAEFALPSPRHASSSTLDNVQAVEENVLTVEATRHNSDSTAVEL